MKNYRELSLETKELLRQTEKSLIVLKKTREEHYAHIQKLIILRKNLKIVFDDFKDYDDRFKVNSTKCKSYLGCSVKDSKNY